MFLGACCTSAFAASTAAAKSSSRPLLAASSSSAAAGWASFKQKVKVFHITLRRKLTQNVTCLGFCYGLLFQCGRGRFPLSSKCWCFFGWIQSQAKVLQVSLIVLVPIFQNGLAAVLAVPTSFSPNQVLGFTWVSVVDLQHLVCVVAVTDRHLIQVVECLLL